MGQVIQFRPRQTVVDDKDKLRIEAMVKGELEVYTCDNCNNDFEVYFNKKPRECPHCHVEFTGWND